MKTRIIFLLICFSIHISATTTNTPDYLALIDKSLYVEYAETKMEVFKNEKLQKYYEMELYRSGSKMRMEFSGPATEKGRRMLNEDTNLWMYMPRTSKVMKLPLKQAFMGSDASNRDLMRCDFKRDYDIVNIADGKDNYILLELKAKDLSVSYHKVIIHFDTIRQIPAIQEMYALSGKLIKIIEYVYEKSADGKYDPSEIIIKDELLKNSLTKMYYSKVKRTNNKPAVFFTLGSIKQ